MVGHAALNITNSNETYFFQGDKYVKIHWKPGTTDEGISYGPTEFRKEWPSLKEAGFDKVDAIFPLPGHDHRAYFFSGNKFVRIEYVPGTSKDKILGKVHHITDSPALADAGFDHVDGGLLVPGRSDEAYVFSGEKYARIRFTEGSADDELLDGPKSIRTGWKTSFKSFDIVLTHPTDERGVYFFSQDKYEQLQIVVGGYDKVVSKARDVASYWPALKKAGFYQ